MHHLVREIAVIREDDQAIGVLIEPSDIEEQVIVPDVYKVTGVLRLIRIVVRAHVAARLIERDVVKFIRRLYRLGIDLDDIILLDLHAHLADDLVVDHDAPLPDKLLAGSSGAYSAFSHICLQPDWVDIRISLDLLCHLLPSPRPLRLTSYPRISSYRSPRASAGPVCS